jgi:hypothetical protein
VYSLTYRRKFSPFKRTIHGVIGHSYNPQTDKMWILSSSGGREIMKWSSCEIFLGPDWKAHVDQLEKDRIIHEARAKGGE